MKIHSKIRREAFTLIELIVVIGILAVVISLIVAGIIRVRESGLRIESTNNLKQIVLGTHSFAGTRNGRLPPLGDADTQIILQTSSGIPQAIAGETRPALLVQLLPFVQQAGASRNKGKRLPVRLYVSPADPSAIAGVANGEALASYAANAVVFRKNSQMPASFTDGTSNTILFAERYANCQWFTYYYWYHAIGPGVRPAFADLGDEVPETSGDPPVSRPKSAWRTFQVAPSKTACNAMVPQTPHPGGMLTALADGSVRQIAPSISVTTFWGAVTPAGGEVLGSDW